MTDDLPIEKIIADEIKKQHLTPGEMATIIQNLKSINPRKYVPQIINFSERKLKYGWFSDAHMGHKHFRQEVYDSMVKYFKREGVEFIVNAGDTIEGMSNRDGHVFELDYVGMEAQLGFFKEQFEKLQPLKVYSIEADSSHGGWSRNKGNQGFNIGEELNMRADNYIFLGFDEQDLKLENGLTIRLRHPGDGVAYALSYKMQQYVNSISGGHKPHIIHQGHYHKFNQMFYRNIHCIDSATLEQQSPFMKKKGTPAHVGYGVAEVHLRNDGGVERFKNEFIPFYD